jgi:hypothetical protein
MRMRHVLIPIGVAALGALLAGCGTPAPMMSEEPLAWVRTDGQSGRANPALVDQFASDRAACGIPATSDNAALRAAQGCMSQHGYVLVPASEAEATAAKFRASSAYPAKG